MIDWRALSKHPRFTVRADVIDVSLPDGRRHRVTVSEEHNELRLTARIATRTPLSRLEAPELFVWNRNRNISLVGFRLDRHDSVVGEAWVPSHGLDAEDFSQYVLAVAEECDRLEALLTGEDDE